MDVQVLEELDVLVLPVRVKEDNFKPIYKEATELLNVSTKAMSKIISIPMST